MNNDFYSRLFTYKAKPDREPREDFLSELFCELLNTIAASQYANDIGALLNLSELGCDWKSITWRTQFPIDGGRCDLVRKTTGDVKESAFIIIENKIGAGFTVGSGGDEQHQLIRYRRYLESRSEKHKSLILVSLYSFSSVSMLPSNNIISWRDVAKKLGQLLSKLREQQTLLASQLIWLINFMRSNSMTEVNISLQDIASTTSWRRLETSCRALGGETARQVLLGGVNNLQNKLNEVGIFQPNGWGDFGNPGIFNGVIYTPRKSSKLNYGIKASDSNLVVCVGILLAETYRVPTLIADVPEFFAAVCLWVSKDDTARAESAIAPIYRVLSSLEGWTSKQYSHTADTEVFVIRRSKSFTAMYDENVDWLDYARSFYISAAADLSLVNGAAWASLITFAMEGVDENEKSGGSENES
ncbi:PD-(D/E)XK nuclease family protein [Acidithiobacillus ferrooxidans]|uniref:PD-(D/E)XK nuclease family protein n=2 Tax=Acidithiobacillus ferrooxidans TaxID=920 RepID=UPI002148BC89|nr:PD-(D/E)XK nuclease family protein [Acidithiobacillus ferrooxidans]MCR1341861.1 PD-(D/E)XK nuclease family protein [Acidithiobacillus ferrooxidans]